MIRQADMTSVIAHRGFHGTNGAYENTLEACDAAISAGVDLVETDVRRTRDGVLVIHHDPDVGGRKIAETDYADLPVLPNGTRMPKLSELAALTARRGAKLVVEMKEKGYERSVVDTLLAEGPAAGFELISFEASSVRAVEDYHPEIRTGLLAPRVWEWLRESGLPWKIIRTVLDPFHLPVKRATKAGADYLSLDRRSATNGMIDAARGAGLLVDVWTVDDPKECERFVNDPRIRGVVTNHPDVAMRLRRPASGGDGVASGGKD